MSQARAAPIQRVLKKEVTRLEKVSSMMRSRMAAMVEERDLAGPASTGQTSEVPVRKRLRLAVASMLQLRWETCGRREMVL